MIYTVTFNPALDYTLHALQLHPGETNRSSYEELSVGGKGINVSLVLRELGEPSVALGFIAGFTGEALAEKLSHMGVRSDFITLPSGFTRINVKLKAELETEINAAGPRIDKHALAALFKRLERLAEEDTLVLAGSVPGGVAGNIYEQIAKRLLPRGIRLVVDAAGALLMSVLPYRPFLIKPNRAELSEALACPLQSDAQIADAAMQLQARGAQNVLVSLGKEGAVLLDAQKQFHKIPAVGGKPVNTVGAGDSMVAGFLAGYGRTEDYKKALYLAGACGGATTCSPGLARREQIEELYSGLLCKHANG